MKINKQRMDLLSISRYSMSSQYSTEAIIKQIGSGILSGGVIGVLISKGQHIIACLTFTSIGLIDVAYHFNYSQAHITHLTYERFRTQRDIRSRFNNLQRNIQRELREPPDDLNQELQWFWNDLRRYIDQHIYYGMGFSMAFLLTVVLFPKTRH
jgi:hypothetical protein